eukprot:445892_1
MSTVVCLFQLLLVIGHLSVHICNGVPMNPITLYPINCSQLSGNEIFLGESISGLYALHTKQPSLWLGIPSWSDSLMWLNAVKQGYGNNIIYNTSFQSLNGIISLTNYLLSDNPSFEVNGYLKANLKNESIHYALSLAFHYKALIATDDVTENALKSPPLNLKLLRDFTTERNSTYLSIFNEFVSYSGNINDFIIFQHLSKYQYLSDFVIASKSFIFYTDNMESPVVHAIFSILSQSNKARLLGWGASEGDLVGTSSKYNISVVASDFSENLSQFYLLNNTKQTKPLNVAAKRSIKVEQYHYVTFLFTDGDNLQWLQNGFFHSDWYGSDLRGQFPVSWTISGSVQEMAPIVYNTIMNNATGNDSFAMAPSGYGYEIIEDCNDIASFGLNTAASIANSDNILQNINVIDDWNNATGYGPNINAMLDNGDGRMKSILYYFGEAYCGGNGNIFWYKNYPIITGKQALWSGHNDYQQLAAKLNSYPVDPSKDVGYSLIPVHVWSQNMANVSKCIGLLDNTVKVVGIDDFVDLVVQNVRH